MSSSSDECVGIVSFCSVWFLSMVPLSTFCESTVFVKLAFKLSEVIFCLGKAMFLLLMGAFPLWFSRTSRGFFNKETSKSCSASCLTLASHGQLETTKKPLVQCFSLEASRRCGDWEKSSSSEGHLSEKSGQQSSKTGHMTSQAQTLDTCPNFDTKPRPQACSHVAMAWHLARVMESRGHSLGPCNDGGTWSSVWEKEEKTYWFVKRLFIIWIITSLLYMSRWYHMHI